MGVHPDFCVMTAAQIKELQVSRKLAPWGYRAVTHGQALIWEVLVNANLRAGAPKVRAEMLLPKQGRLAQTWDQAKLAFMSMGARVTNGGSG